MDNSFAIYREANDNQIYLCKGNCQKLPENLAFHNFPHGFIISPWAKSNELWCILGDIENISEIKVLDFLRDFVFEINETQTSSTTYNEFKNEVLSIQKEIGLNNFEKAVASRIESSNENLNIEKIASWFQLLLQNHQNSFVSLVYTSEFGLWIGATPETLISYKNNVIQTMSLAGTLINKNDQWSAKEALEQSVTSKFIYETLLVLKTELNNNEKLLTEQETPPIANVLLCVGFSFVIPFGKYKGRTLFDISEENPSYIKWLDEKSIYKIEDDLLISG